MFCFSVIKEERQEQGGETAGAPPCGIRKGAAEKKPVRHVVEKLSMFTSDIYPVFFYGSRVYA